jgi:hypothetical protein
MALSALGRRNMSILFLEDLISRRRKEYFTMAQSSLSKVALQPLLNPDLPHPDYCKLHRVMSRDLKAQISPTSKLAGPGAWYNITRYS